MLIWQAVFYLWQKLRCRVSWQTQEKYVGVLSSYYSVLEEDVERV